MDDLPLTLTEAALRVEQRGLAGREELAGLAAGGCSEQILEGRWDLGQRAATTFDDALDAVAVLTVTLEAMHRLFRKLQVQRRREFKVIPADDG